MGTPTPSHDDARAATRGLTALGWSEDRIARVLAISPRTVRRYRSEAHAVVAAIRADSRTLDAELARRD